MVQPWLTSSASNETVLMKPVFATTRRLKVVVVAYCLVFSWVTAPAQRKQSRPQQNPLPASARRHSLVAQLVGEIDARNIENSILKLVSFGTRNTLSEQNDPARGIGAARDWIFSEFSKAAEQSGGRMTVEKQTFEQPKGDRIPNPTTITNIVATLNGTHPESTGRTYVVSGHYDSMCSSPTDGKCDAPGANDDASGTAAVLELARVMSKHEFDATIIFMAVAGEEQGLYGSIYFAEQAKKRGMDVEAMFTNDIIGNSLGGNGVRDRHTVRVFSEGVPSNETPEEANIRRGVGGENDSPSRQLARFTKETAERYVRGMRVTMIYRRDRYLRGGDHRPFLERGFAAVRFTEPNEDYRHQHQNVRIENGIQYGDLPQFVDFSYVANVTRVNAASLAMLALAPARPRNVGVVTARLTNDTDLKWDANKERDLAGYEVVWRDTTSPVWTNTRWVGKVTSYTVKGMSKDNFFFGVRAVDKDSNRSPVSYPKPVR
jgi:Zn-dependent M28 family amino/carboxypeptidase